MIRAPGAGRRVTCGSETGLREENGRIGQVFQQTSGAAREEHLLSRLAVGHAVGEARRLRGDVGLGAGLGADFDGQAVAGVESAGARLEVEARHLRQIGVQVLRPAEMEGVGGVLPGEVALPAGVGGE